MIHKPKQRPWAEFAYTAIQEENSRWYENIGNLLSPEYGQHNREVPEEESYHSLVYFR
jgi:hypothetical protein